MDEGCNKVVIIGGGAAGYFAAITAAEKKPNAQVLLFEAGDRVLRKVKISGGGRCNLTHHCYEPKELSSHYPRGSKELRGAFHHWQPRDTIEWFETRGVKTKVETDGRVFPITDNSQSVIDCLRTEAKNLGVSEHLRTRVTDLKQINNQWELEINQSEKIIADRVCLALGSLRGTGMEKTLTALGHIISPLIPSLFAFNLPEHPMVELAGISVPHAQAKTLPNGKPQHGPLLITHRGLSGPCILRLSAWDAQELAACKYKFEIEINWLGDHSLEKTKEVVSLYRKQFAVAKVSTNPSNELPKRLWAHLVDHAKISRDTTWAHLSKKEEQKLVKALGTYRCKVSGKTTNKEEFVTCGGVSLKQVDFRTMESKLAPGLHFAGECLDFDGITGGFNFQAAWTTGHLAGQSIAMQTGS